MTDKKLEERIRACREIDMELTMENMNSFFSDLVGEGVDCTFTQVPTDYVTDVQDLVSQIQEWKQQFDQQRMIEIAQVLRNLNPSVAEQTIDRITPYTLILVPEHSVEPGQPLRDFVRAHPWLNGEIVVIFDNRSVLWHPGTPSVM